MKIFLCYPKNEKDQAEPIALALRARGFEVFLDDDDLPPGRDYNVQIEAAIESADYFIFLISPDSVDSGRYTLSELEFAKRKWRKADGKVLPVMIRPTNMADIPAFLKSVDILMPKGNAAAEVSSAVAEIFQPPKASLVVPLFIILGAASGFLSMLLPQMRDVFVGEFIVNHSDVSPFWAPLLFTVVVGWLLFRWSIIQYFRLIYLLLLVTLGWLTAINLARIIIEFFNGNFEVDPSMGLEEMSARTSLLGWLAGGIAGGAFGALATMLGVGAVTKKLFSFENVVSAVLVGGVVGMLLYVANLRSFQIGTEQFSIGGTWLVITSWQAAMAGLIAFYLSRIER